MIKEPKLEIITFCNWALPVKCMLQFSQIKEKQNKTKRMSERDFGNKTQF